MVDEMSFLFRSDGDSEVKHDKQPEKPPYSIARDLAECLAAYKHFITFEIEDYEFAFQLDQTVMEVEREGVDAILPLIEFMKSKWYIEEDNYIERWWRFLVPRLKKLRDLPKDFVKIQILFGLYRHYSSEFLRIQKPIGSSEFADIVGWKGNKFRAYAKKKGVLPKPYAKLKSTPLWNVGQAESFKRVLLHRELTGGKRRDWNTQHLGKFADRNVKLEKREDGLYYFCAPNSGESVPSFFEGVLFESFPIDEVKKMGDLLFQMSNEPIILEAMGCSFIKNGDLVLAKKYFEKALSIYSKAIPEDFTGHFDSIDSYIGTLVQLAYLYVKEDRVEKAKSLLQLAIERTNINDQSDEQFDIIIRDGLSVLRNSPEKFTKWFEENQ
ncbi:tetratricopeptide (TPR) repeat protein [Evansella vedderi]|uniref:Tetratricopeptide (TPR) repeat protein n=1 Tax=Evansella vedderi TaxID=38282 RepID=A0ABT9ZWL2_9BACI|nr:hypothetical protein [Evansella vedderi]MDQ0255622.1 tetratricopeptide (TPR) repeat protein [Evansella vedderi]